MLAMGLGMPAILRLTIMALPVLEFERFYVYHVRPYPSVETIPVSLGNLQT
jgi:hypothetical protein